jgi:hypothetical protein
LVAAAIGTLAGAGTFPSICVGGAIAGLAEAACALAMSDGFLVVSATEAGGGVAAAGDVAVELGLVAVGGAGRQPTTALTKAAWPQTMSPIVQSLSDRKWQDKHWRGNSRVATGRLIAAIKQATKSRLALSDAPRVAGGECSSMGHFPWEWKRADESNPLVRQLSG